MLSDESANLLVGIARVGGSLKRLVDLIPNLLPHRVRGASPWSYPQEFSAAAMSKSASLFCRLSRAVVSTKAGDLPWRCACLGRAEEL